MSRKGIYRKQHEKGRVSEKWYVSFTDHLERRHRTPAFESKQASEEYRRNLKRLASDRSQGLPLSPELQRWARGLPASYVKRLVQWDLLDGRWLASEATIDRHLHEWAVSLEDRGRTPNHVELYESRVARVVAATGVERWAQLTAERLERAWLGLRTKHGKPLHPGTLNHYRTALIAFGRWMERTGRATSNPAAGLQLRRVTDRRERRPLQPDEVEWLLRTTERAERRTKRRRDGGFHFDITGPERATLYLLAIETGLRSGEIAKLRVCDLDLASKYPTITLPARVSKNRKAAPPIPLRPEMAARLRVAIEGKHPEAAAINHPGKLNCAGLLRDDMAAARAAWIAAGATPEERHRRGTTSFLSPVDERGDVVDFHALRTTTANWLAAAGVTPYAMQQLMRHGDIATTMAHYVKANPEAARAALAQMPELRLTDGPHVGPAVG